MAHNPRAVALVDTRRMWIHAQGLAQREPLGGGPAAIKHLGYVQIDSISVIERSYHHILFSRIPTYRRDHLRQAQSIDKSAFEYWTRALSYIAMRDLHGFSVVLRRATHRKGPFERRWDHCPDAPCLLYFLYTLTCVSLVWRPPTPG